MTKRNSYIWQTLEILKRTLGEEHPSTLGSMNNLAVVYTVPKAATTKRNNFNLQTLEIEKRTISDKNIPAHWQSMNNLAIVYKATRAATAKRKNFTQANA